jgi:hypothetical protein
MVDLQELRLGKPGLVSVVLLDLASGRTTTKSKSGLPVFGWARKNWAAEARKPLPRSWWHAAAAVAAPARPDGMQPEMAWLARPQFVRARGFPAPRLRPGEVQPQVRQRTASARSPTSTSSSCPMARHFTVRRTRRTVKERRAGAPRDHSMMMRIFMAFHGSAPAGPAGPWPLAMATPPWPTPA